MLAAVVVFEVAQEEQVPVTNLEKPDAPEPLTAFAVTVEYVPEAHRLTKHPD